MMKWTDSLPDDVFIRFATCGTIKRDIPLLAQARWNHIKNEAGFTKEDALVYVLELLDCNSCYFDLTRAEYDEILNGIV